MAKMQSSTFLLKRSSGAGWAFAAGFRAMGGAWGVAWAHINKKTRVYLQLWAFFKKYLKFGVLDVGKKNEK